MPNRDAMSVGLLQQNSRTRHINPRSRPWAVFRYREPFLPSLEIQVFIMILLQRVSTT
jgi:hypothetical protein